MKANELRIGNYIVDDTMYVPPDESFMPVNAELILNVSEGRYVPEPIPITEAWLKDFGFERKDSSVAAQFYIGINPKTQDYMMTLVWLKDMYAGSLKDSPFYRNGYHKIKYVHQLQNLYFALTGEDL